MDLVVILGSLLWSWVACCHPLEGQGDLNSPFIVFLALTQDKAVLLPFIFFREFLLRAIYFEEVVKRDFVVVHGGCTYVLLSSWPSCGTRLG